jgi:hypothetical protein
VPPRYIKQCAAAKEDFLPYRRKVEHSDWKKGGAIWWQEEGEGEPLPALSDLVLSLKQTFPSAKRQNVCQNGPILLNTSRTCDQKVTEARTREGEREWEGEGARERMADIPQEQGPRLQNRREGCLL